MTVGRRQFGIILAVVAMSIAINWYAWSNVNNRFDALRGGLCKIIVHSNALAQENKVALLATAARAAHRAQIDSAEGHASLAQTDRDAALLDQKFADEIQPTRLSGCPT